MSADPTVALARCRVNVGIDFVVGVIGRAVSLGRIVALSAPLGCHVGHVVAVSPEEQAFLGVTAWRVIAVMEDIYPCRDRSMSQLPRKAVGENHFSIDSDPPVTFAVGVSSPFEAPIKLPLKASNKALGDWQFSLFRSRNAIIPPAFVMLATHATHERSPAFATFNTASGSLHD